MDEFAGQFWLYCLALILLAAGFIATPLWRARRGTVGGSETDRIQTNIELFKERKLELEAEFDAGYLERDQLDALLLELQKSLLIDVDSAEQTRRPVDTEPGAWRSPAFLAPLILLLLPLAAWLMYQQWGQLDDVELMDQFQRTVQNENDPETARDLVLSLGQVVQEDAERPWAWYFLGENLSTLGMFDVASSAYQQAAERFDDDAEKALAMGRVVLTGYIMEQLRITPEIQQLIDQTLALNPDEPNILQLLASDAQERKDYDAAIGYWRRLSQMNPDSQMARDNIANLQRLRGGAAAAAGGPAIEVTVTIAESLPLDPRLRVFVSARNAQVDGMPPLAVADLTVSDLPAQIRLDDSMAVGPFNLSSADSVYVSALVSQAGTANRASGDYLAESEAFTLESPPEPVELVISEVVP